MSGSTVRDTLGFLGVMASLVFVGVEIHQNTAAIRGQTRQALNVDYREWQMTLASNPDLFQRYTEYFGLSPDGHPTYAMNARLRNLENVFLQVREGVVDESVFLSYGWGDSQSFMSPQFRDWWLPRRDHFHPDFVASFEAEYDLHPK